MISVVLCHLVIKGTGISYCCICKRETDCRQLSLTPGLFHYGATQLLHSSKKKI